MIQSEEEKHRVRWGKNGYLFQTDENIFGRLTGEVNLSPEELAIWTETFRERKRIAEAAGAQYFMFVVPERHVVYREFLPDGVVISEERPIRRLLAQDDLAEAIVYPLAAMQESRAVMEPYPRGGSHWNGFGAFVGYREICARIGEIPVPAGDFEWTSSPVPGGCDLEERLSLDTGPYIMYKKKVSHGHAVYDNAIWALGNVKVFKNDNPDLPSAVIFRDSFSMKLLPLLCESFSRIVAVVAGAFYPEIIESERPGFVITQIAERYLTPHMADVPHGTFEDYCKVSPAQISQMWTGR